MGSDFHASSVSIYDLRWIHEFGPVFWIYRTACDDSETGRYFEIFMQRQGYLIVVQSTIIVGKCDQGAITVCFDFRVVHKCSSQMGFVEGAGLGVLESNRRTGLRVVPVNACMWS